ncbi:REP element-mobilizing transposase RayT [Algoriphagus sp. 4150]|nr:REP element-mobilizing transposase RayT [Algoriphagus sp. 4150]
MEQSQSYHIYNHANGAENIFRAEENYRFFLQQYAKYLGEVVDTYAYCLMPNHFHLLVSVKSEEMLRSTFPKFQTLEKLVSKQFSNFFSSYTQSFNKVYERKGSLFIKNLKEPPFSLSANGRRHFYIYTSTRSSMVLSKTTQTGNGPAGMLTRVQRSFQI